MSSITLSRALIAGGPEALDAVHDPDIALAIWERDPPAAIAGLLAAPIGPVSFASPLGRPLTATLGRALDEARYPLTGARAALEADIGMLANRFARIMAADAVEVRLERIVTDSCRKFHADYVRARLITTYAGPGTQWLDETGPEACDCGEPHGVRQLRAGDVAILKGRHWDETRAAIHRSPPIAGSGAARLVLVINPANMRRSSIGRDRGRLSSAKSRSQGAVRSARQISPIAARSPESKVSPIT